MARLPAALCAAFLVVAPVAGAGPPAGYAADFTAATMRVDFVHLGDAASESIAVVRVLREGEWPGSRVHLVDATNLGAYKAEVRAPGGRLLWSYGLGSTFGEYRATAAAKQGVERAFEQSVRFPWPRRPVRLVLLRRGRDGSYRKIFATTIDPEDPTIVREGPSGGVLVVPPKRIAGIHRAVDIAILGEGYTRAQAGRYRQDLARFTGVLLGQEPYRSLRSRINVWGVLPYSGQGGCDEPGRGVWRRTALDAHFDAFGSPRYLLTENNRAVRDAAAHVPYDTIVIMVNHDRYGGGGIYNLYCTFTAHNRWSAYLFLHELGHSFAGLADEYFSSATAYENFYPRGIEPPEPNITALADPSHLKWRDLVSPGTPIPTPWNKAAYERVETAYQEQRQALNRKVAAAMRRGAPEHEIARLRARADRLAQRNARRVRALFARERYADRVGAFEGAGYAATGMYRPMLDCIMFSRGRKPYCRVCERAIRRMIETRGE